MQDFSHRQNEILALARSAGRVSVDDLAARFDVTPQTIRKDLNDLCDRRLLNRVHGGAVVASGIENLGLRGAALHRGGGEAGDRQGGRRPDPEPRARSSSISAPPRKRSAANLMGHEELLVITNNLNVAMLLYRPPDHRGDRGGRRGPAHRRRRWLARDAVDLDSAIQGGYAVIGASAIDEDGALLDFDYREVKVSPGHNRKRAQGDPGGGPAETGAGRPGEDRTFVANSYVYSPIP